MSMPTDSQGTVHADKRGLKAELGIIPIWSYVLAAVIFVAIPICFFGFIWPREEAPPPPLLATLMPFVIGTILAFLALMIGYVNRDAGRRGMSRTLWTLIVIFVPNAIGFILYFLLRSPTRTQCPKCNAVVTATVNYCPNCRYSFHPTCPQCKAPVRPPDKFCVNCGSRLEETAQ